MQAIGNLLNQGYTLSVDQDDLVVKYTGQGQPDPATVRPLLEELRAHKQDAITFLRQRENPTTLYQAVADELAALWQPGTRAYIEQSLPALAQEIDQAEAQLNTTWLAVESGTGDMNTFKQGLAQWRDANLRAAQAYNDTLPLAAVVNEKDARALGATCREHIRKKGYCLIKSQALGGEVIAVVDSDHRRNLAPAGHVVYTVAELTLLAEGHGRVTSQPLPTCGCCTRRRNGWAG